MSEIVEKLRGFFEWENLKNLLEKIYSWSETALGTIFGKISYDPIRELLTNPWFWLIIILLIFIGLIFRRR